MKNKSKNRLPSPILLYTIIIIIIVVLTERVYTQEIFYTSYNEAITGLSLLSGDPSSVYPDNTILFRLGRLDPASSENNCNEAKILFRTVMAGYQEIKALELDTIGNNRIPIDCFCETPAPKKRAIYIFDDNYRRHKLVRRTTPTHTKVPPPDPTTPGDTAPKVPIPPDTIPTTPDTTPPPPEGTTPPDATPKGPPEPAPKAAPKAVKDKIRILTFYNNLVLIYYPCGVQYCGDIYSIKNIKVILKEVILAGNCDEVNAVSGPDGFLFLCYRQADSSISWETWTTNGTAFDKVYFGSISDVTVPNELQLESFGGGLFKVFSTGFSSYSIIMGSFSSKLNPKSNIYRPPINLFAYFLTDTTLISGPVSIYQNLENIGTVEFQIQTCHLEVGGIGYKCLISIKVGELDTYTKFVAISFSSTGEVISTNEFDISHEPKALTPATLNLNYGGWCIGLLSTSAGGLNCLAYDEKGTFNGTWGIPIDAYDSVGGAPNNVMWAVLPFTTTPTAMTWSMYFTTKLVNFRPNV